SVVVIILVVVVVVIVVPVVSVVVIILVVVVVVIVVPVVSVVVIILVVVVVVVVVPSLVHQRMPGPQVLKLRYREQVIRRRVESTECNSYSHVLNFITEAWPALVGQQFSVHYVDDDGDKCVLDEQSFGDAVALTRDGMTSLQFFVETPPEAGSRCTPLSASSEGFTECSIADLKTDDPPKEWSLRARVTTTPVLREFERNNFKGSYFTVNLTDERDRIRAIFFNRAARDYGSVLKKDHIYLFRGGQVKPAHKVYNTNDTHEVKFNSPGTSIEEVEILAGRPMPSASSEESSQNSIHAAPTRFITTADVGIFDVGSHVNLTGVCITAEPTETISGDDCGEDAEAFLLADEYGIVRVNAASPGRIGKRTARNNSIVLITNAKVDDNEESRLSFDGSTTIQRRSSSSSRYTDQQDMEIFRFVSNEAAVAVSEGRQVHARGNKIWEKAVQQGVAAPHPAQSIRTRWDRNIADRALEFSQRLADERQSTAEPELSQRGCDHGSSVIISFHVSATIIRRWFTSRLISRFKTSFGAKYELSRAPEEGLSDEPTPPRPTRKTLQYNRPGTSCRTLEEAKEALEAISGFKVCTKGSYCKKDGTYVYKYVCCYGRGRRAGYSCPYAAQIARVDRGGTLGMAFEVVVPASPYDQHKHDQTAGAKSREPILSRVASNVVVQQHEGRGKPLNTFRTLRKRGLLPASASRKSVMKAIYNKRERRREEQDGTGKNLANIRKFCEDHSVRPQTDEEAYCIGYGAGTCTYFAFSCPKLLLENTQGDNVVLTCDHTDGLSWLGLTTLVVGTVAPSGRYRPICFALTTNKKTASTAAVFACIRQQAEALGVAFLPTTILADGAECFTKAFIQ
ncbi:60S acidic ribosomal protein P1, partial [Perkinsus olseni]